MREIKKSVLLTLGFVLLFLLGICLICGIIYFISPTSSTSEEEASPSWSPDGERFAYECYIDGPTERIAESDRRHFTTEAADICTIGIDGRNRVRLTKNQGGDRYPVWSPDRSQIAYTRSDGIYLINADGSNQRRLVQIMYSQSAEEIGKIAWSPKGGQLLFSACLEDPNHDVYLVDVNTGALTNLTSDNGMQDIDPMWTLNGTKVVFWSTTSFVIPETCYPVGNAPSRLKVINVDGSDEKVIYDQEIFYTFASVSNTGQVAFISDLVSKTTQEYLTSSGDAYLYTISLEETEPIKRSTAFRLVSWSPNGKYLVYEDHGFQMLEMETGEILKLPPLPPKKIDFYNAYYLIEDVSDWSPDSQEIAITVSLDTSGFYAEKHIYIFNLQSGTYRPLIQK